MMDYISNLLKNNNVNDGLVGYLSCFILVVSIILISLVVNFVAKNIVLKIFAKVILRNRYTWFDCLIKRKVFTRLANVLPGIVIYLFATSFHNKAVSDVMHRGAVIYIMVMAVFIINSFLDAINDIYSTYPISKIRPMKGLLQVVKIVIYIVIIIVIVGTLMDQNPLVLLSGIGALAAVFSFVFKDTILGFIAGIQLTSNDMLRIGDWIEIGKYGADGDVVDITLNTVKVQNFDKTIVTLPAYALVTDSFKNWRGMTEFGGRRIKRSISIDVNSITFCTQEMIDKYKKIEYLRDYIIEKETELSLERQVQEIDVENRVNGRHLTNIGTFRVYIQEYLSRNPDLMEDMPRMVRQLSPTENGIPLEVYAFTAVTDWGIYETIQADIFDHIISIAEEFDIRIFQNPTGYDWQQK